MWCGGMLLYVAIVAQTNIFMIFIHFGIGPAFEPGSNMNWTSQTHLGMFGPRFNNMAKPEPVFGSVFANFAQELDWTGLQQH